MSRSSRGQLQIQPDDHNTQSYVIEACHATSRGYQYQLAGEETDGRRFFVQVGAEDITNYVSSLQLEDFETSRIDQDHIDAFQAVWGGKKAAARKQQPTKTKRGHPRRQHQKTESLAEPLQPAHDTADASASVMTAPSLDKTNKGRHGRPRPSYAQQVLSLEDLERLERKRAKAARMPRNSRATRQYDSDEGRRSLNDPRELNATGLGSDRLRATRGVNADENNADGNSDHSDDEENNDQLDDNDERQEDDLQQVEEILDRQLSDPEHHPPGFPVNQAVMLYLVRWHGVQELTWEPAFNLHVETIRDYEARVQQNGAS